MTYDKEFEEMIRSTVADSGWTMKDHLWAVWQAARKDHYRIGEEVEVDYDEEKTTGIVVAVHLESVIGDVYTENPCEVRRIPAKSRIDEIAEEVGIEEGKKYGWSPAVIVSAIEIAKAAIMKYREDRKANR